MGIAKDITESKKAEQKLERDLEVRVHRRVDGHDFALPTKEVEQRAKVEEGAGFAHEAVLQNGWIQRATRALFSRSYHTRLPRM